MTVQIAELTAIVHAAAAPMALCRLDGTFLGVSDTFAELVGASGTDLVDHPFASVTYPDDRKGDLALLHELASGDRVFGHRTKRYLRLDGQVVWADTLVSALLGPDGAPAAVLAQVRRSNGPNAEQVTLRESEERFRAAFDNAPVGMAVVGVNGEWLQVNRALCALLGRAMADCAHLRLKDVLHPDHVERARSIRQGMLQGQMGSVRIDTDLLHADGSPLPCDLTASIVRDDDGVPVHFVLHVLERHDHAMGPVRMPDGPRLREIVGASNDLLFFRLRLRPELTFEHISPSVEAFCGFTPEDIYADPTLMFEVVHPDSAAQLASVLHDPAGTPSPLLVRWRHRNGREVVTNSHHAAWFEDGAVAGIEGVLVDVTAQRDAEQALRDTTVTDALTRLPNRILIEDRIERAVIRSRRSRTVAVVLVVDIDDFATINRAVGYEGGDQALKTIAERLASVVPKAHTVGRFAADEFVVCAESLRDVDAARSYAEDLRAAISGPMEVGDTSVDITASVGIAVADAADVTAEDLLACASSAMGQAKAAGGNRHAVYDPATGSLARLRHRREHDLRHAIERREISTHYQPIVELGTGRTVAAEALMRWHHPIDGTIAPDEFIPIAEDRGLIGELTHWVLDDACRQVAAWRGVHGHPRFTVSVNLSAHQLANRSIVETLEATLRKHQLPCQALTVEVTESAAIGYGHLEVLHEIDALGVEVALDDFGTHYSSLSYLQRLPLKQLKIDRTFVTGIAEDRSRRAIVMATAQLARGLDLLTVAEGIEEVRERAELQLFGIDRGQGYLFGRPMTADDFTAHLKAM